MDSIHPTIHWYILNAIEQKKGVSFLILIHKNGWPDKSSFDINWYQKGNVAFGKLGIADKRESFCWKMFWVAKFENALSCKVGKCFELQSWKILWVAKQYLFFTKAALQLYPLAFWLLTRNCIFRKLFCRWKAILYTFQRKCTDLCKNMFFKTASHFHFICQSLVSRPKVGNCPTWRNI